MSPEMNSTSTLRPEGTIALRRTSSRLHVRCCASPSSSPPAKSSPQAKSKKLALQWYYLMHHRTNCTEYMKSRKKLSAETIKSLTDYFQARFAQKKADGLLEHAELDQIRQRAKRMLASSLRKQQDARRISHVRSKLLERGQCGRSGSYHHGNNNGGNSHGKCDCHRQRGVQSAHGHNGCNECDGC